MAISIDWNLLKPANALSNYAQGRDDMTRNALAMRQEERQVASDRRQVDQDAYQRQRDTRTDARADERWAMEKPAMQAKVDDAELQRTYQVLKGITSPEAFASAARDPYALKVIPDLAQQRFEDVTAMRERLGAMFSEPAEYGFQNTTDGVVRTDPRTGKVEMGYAVTPRPDAPNWEEVTDADGSTRFIELPGRPTQQPNPAAPQGQSAPGGFDAVYDGFVAPQEGGYTSSDGNGSPANFGINQGANPDIDVKSLTPDRARDIYKQRYWGPSGAESLPAPLQAVHFDTAVNMGVGAAKQLLDQSGGDPRKYLQLREARYRSIAQSNPSRAPALPTWLRRNQQLGEFIGGGGQEALAGGGGPAPLRSIPGSAPKPSDRWEDLPGGGQRNTRTNEIKGVPSAAEKAPTVDEGSAAKFSYRMFGANDTMNTLVDQGIIRPTVGIKITEENGIARLVAENPKDALYMQAANEWIMAKLRRESGAAIGTQELANEYRTYFAEPQDSVQLIRQKAEARRRAMVSELQQGRRAYERTYGPIPRSVETRVPKLQSGRSAPPSGWKASNGYMVSE
jgi:hypothetical protein